MSKFVNLKRNLKDDAFANHDTANTLVGTLTSLTSTKGHVLIGCTISNIHNASVTVDVALIENSSNVKIVRTPLEKDSVDTKADIMVSVLENA